MKKLLTVMIIGLMSVSSLMAAETRRNGQDDGSLEDSYVPGQKKDSPVEKKEMGTGQHYGDGSHEDKFVPGEKKNVPQSKDTIHDSEEGPDDDGSPAE